MVDALHSGSVFCLFFFQAEDGIRDSSVTGVQTCALPICGGGDRAHRLPPPGRRRARSPPPPYTPPVAGGDSPTRDRKSVVSGKRVDLGGRRIIKKKKSVRTQLTSRTHKKKEGRHSHERKR